jgi:hypothetical protein
MELRWWRSSFRSFVNSWLGYGRLLGVMDDTTIVTRYDFFCIIIQRNNKKVIV